jgi:hypothetical protein
MEVLHSPTRSICIALFAFEPLLGALWRHCERKLVHPTSMTFLFPVERMFTTAGGLLLASS